MDLSSSEQAWLNAYRDRLAGDPREPVQRMFVYGSKARGDHHPDSDLDVLLIVNDSEVERKRELRRMGYQLAAATEVVPSILAYTVAEWDSRRLSDSPFRRAVERDEVAVL